MSKNPQGGRKANKSGFNKISHPDGPCGNQGCRKCLPPIGKVATLLTAGLSFLSKVTVHSHDAKENTYRVQLLSKPTSPIFTAYPSQLR